MKRWMAIGFLLLSGLAWGVWHYRQTTASLPVLDVAEVQQGDLLSAITAMGSLQARRSVDIKFDGQNYIQQLYGNEGDHVRQGQMVACLETQLLNHARDGAQQTIEKDEASLAQAEANLQREEALWKEQLVAGSSMSQPAQPT